MVAVGQTPGVFVKAGGTELVFPPECVVALAKIGLEPGDFGTYKEVRAQQDAAREKCKAWDDEQAKPTGKAVPKPTEHDRFIAGCEAGHLTQNATQQRTRGSACSNATPGYNDEDAPCAPHYGGASTPGTEHYLVTRKEANKPRSEAAEVGDKTDKESFPPTARAKADADRGAEVQAAIANNNKEYPKQLKPAKNDPDQAKAAQNFREMQEAREKAAKEVQKDPQYTQAKAAADPADLKKIDEEKNGETAAACIESFRQAAMRAMKKRSADPAAIRDAEAKAAEGSQPAKKGSKQTKQEAADEKLKAAQEREKKAKANAAGIPRSEKDDPNNIELVKARQARKEAEQNARQYKDAECRAKQGKLLNPETGDAKGDPVTKDGLTGGFGKRPGSGTPVAKTGPEVPGKSKE